MGVTTKAKTFQERFGIGKSKYVVSFYDGKKVHSDGSPACDIRIFSNKIKQKTFVKSLIEQGFTTSHL